MYLLLRLHLLPRDTEGCHKTVHALSEREAALLNKYVKNLLVYESCTTRELEKRRIRCV